MVFIKMDTERIEEWARIKKEDVPKYLIVDCAWPWKRNINDAAYYIRNPVAHPRWTFPFFGYHPKLPKVKVGYNVVFGSSMATQLYFYLKLGVKYVFQTGTIGSIQDKVKICDLVIPKTCLKFDWVSQQFHSPKTVSCDNKLLNTVKNSLDQLKFKNYHIGKTVSVATNWIETPEREKKWISSGMLGIDEETATVYSICKAFDVKPIALLRVMDAHRKGQEMGKRAYDERDKKKLEIK